MKRLLFAVLALGIAGCAPQAHGPQPSDIWNAPQAPAYNYPIQNPYAATIITVPPDMRLDYSELPKPVEKTIYIFPDRTIPEGFWYDRGLRYSEMLQKHPAPLVYVIAGTGADQRSSQMAILGNVLYSAGFSVVLLPSPTSQNFILNASGNYMVGRPMQSAEDLYRVMQMIDMRVAKDTTITARMLTGYSLGALDAAFTAKLDDEQHFLNFSRVLLINPPYSLYSSITVISDMLYKGLPHGISDADGFIKSMLRRLHNAEPSEDALDFSNEKALIKAYEKYQPDDATLASMIGLSFRYSAASMAFDADVMSESGYIYPKGRPFTTGTDLTHSMNLALRTSFLDYFNEFYAQRMRTLYPGMSKEQMVEESSLAHIAPYLTHNPKFALITNQDDIILAPGEVEKLASMFSPNAYVFANGGHVGNLGSPTVGYTIVHFMRGGAQ